MDAPDSEHEGLFLIVVNEKWDYINRRGEIAIQPQFEEATDFSDGLAAVKLQRKMARVKIGTNWSYIGRTGRVIRAGIRP